MELGTSKARMKVHVLIKLNNLDAPLLPNQRQPGKEESME
jgi:hypothetical protein